jgi:hypothetical protein
MAEKWDVRNKQTGTPGNQGGFDTRKRAEAAGVLQADGSFATAEAPQQFFRKQQAPATKFGLTPEQALTDHPSTARSTTRCGRFWVIGPFAAEHIARVNDLPITTTYDRGLHQVILYP